MTLVSISDNFNRADEALNQSGGNWVGRSRTVVNVVSNQAACTASSSGVMWHLASYAGKQTVEATIVNLGATNVVRLLAAVQNTTAAPGDTFNIYAAGAPVFYRWGSDGNGDYRLVRKIEASSGNTDLFVHPVTPANGHKLKMTWDPATNTVEVFLDTGGGYGAALTTYVDTSGLAPPDTHTRVGFHLENLAIIDDWAASYETSDGGGGSGSGGWEFSEWQGGVAPTGTEVSLTVEGEWSGGTAPTGSVATLDVAQSFVYPTDTSTLPLVQPLWSEHIRDGTGVNAHYKFSNASTNVYSNISTVTALLIELNVGWHRDRMVDANQNAYTTQMTQGAILQASDIGSHYTLSQGNPNPGWDTTTAADMAHYWGTMADRPSWKWSTGGPNEPNDSPKITNWASKLLNHMRLAYEARAANGMEHVPICGPSLKDAEASLQSDYSTFAALNPGQYLDYGDYHRYPYGSSVSGDPTWQVYHPDANGKTPEYLQDLRIGWVDACYGKSQNYCTEGGFSNNIARTNGPTPFPDDVQAYYWERLLWSQLTPKRFGGKNIKRMFMYELLNDYPETLTSVQSWWGIVKTPSLNPATWIKMPAFYRLKNMMAMVADVGGGYHPVTNPFVPPKVRLQIECQDNDSRFRYCVIAKRNGEVRLVYWLDKSWWDQNSGGSYIADPGEKDVTVTTSDGVTVLSGTAAVGGGASRIVKSYVIA
jgi:hypothetical protein